jgi:AcrR family transcriptional regulator
VSQTYEEIAARAAAEFHRRGITATGVDALSRAAGISKRTLYERFGSKDGLIVAAYESLDLPVFERFTQPAEAAGDDAQAQIDGLFAQLEVMVGLPEFRGCPFSNAAAELSDPAHPAHTVVQRHKERIRRWLRTRLRRLGAADSEGLSRQLMVLFAGAQAQALVTRSVRPARDARTAAHTLVEAALQSDRSR